VSHFVSREDCAESDQRERKGSRADFRAARHSGGPCNRRGIAQSECSEHYDQRVRIREGMTNGTISIEKVHVKLLLHNETAQRAGAEVNLLQTLCKRSLLIVQTPTVDGTQGAFLCSAARATPPGVFKPPVSE
jgi:hypothetical protein